MTSRTLFREVLRTLVTALFIAVPLLIPSGVPFATAALGARLAYDGPHARGAAAVGGALLVGELLFGLTPGVLALPYLGVAFLAAASGRLVALSPLAAAEGWDFRALAHALIVACVLGACVTAGSVLVGALYGYGLPGARMAVSFSPAAMQGLAVASLVVLLIFRRIDVPFRRPITFAS